MLFVCTLEKKIVGRHKWEKRSKVQRLKQRNKHEGDQVVVWLLFSVDCGLHTVSLNKWWSKRWWWNQRNISMPGRLTLINVVLTALPLFYLSFFRALKAVINRLSAIQRQFLWGGNQEGKKIAWVSWTQCSTSRDVGGLGVKDLRILNNSPLI